MQETTPEPAASPERESKIRKRWFILALFAVVLLAMFVTKPDQNNFQNWLNYQLNKPGKNVLTTALKRSVRLQANYHIEYSDRWFFAIAETKVGSEKMMFVGVFGTWLPVST